MENIAVEQNVIDPSRIKGWGVDADAHNDPTYPMKLRNDGEHKGYSWERPAQQPLDIEVLHSNERPNVAATFGTALPPSGLSGVIRRAAFNFSESSYGHWVPLMLADRVGMVEGVIDDLSRGRVPNIFSEMGWNVEWKHNRKRFLTRLLVKGIVIGGTAAYLRSGKQKKRPKY